MVLGSTQPLVKMSTRNIPGGKGGRCLRPTTSLPPRAECHEIWEPKPPGTLWVTPGLLGTPLPLPYISSYITTPWTAHNIRDPNCLQFDNTEDCWVLVLEISFSCTNYLTSVGLSSFLKENLGCQDGHVFGVNILCFWQLWQILSLNCRQY